MGFAAHHTAIEPDLGRRVGMMGLVDHPSWTSPAALHIGKGLAGRPVGRTGLVDHPSLTGPAVLHIGKRSIAGLPSARRTEEPVVGSHRSVVQRIETYSWESGTGE